MCLQDKARKKNSLLVLQKAEKYKVLAQKTERAYKTGQKEIEQVTLIPNNPTLFKIT